MFKKIAALGAAAALCVGLMSGCGASGTAGQITAEKLAESREKVAKAIMRQIRMKFISLPAEAKRIIRRFCLRPEC